jgi:hypothetical protein
MRTDTNSSSSVPSPSPSSAQAWVQEDDQGKRWVFYKSSSGEVSRGQQLPDAASRGPQPTAVAPPRPNCIWTGFCWFCP